RLHARSRGGPGAVHADAAVASRGGGRAASRRRARGDAGLWRHAGARRGDVARAADQLTSAGSGRRSATPAEAGEAQGGAPAEQREAGGFGNDRGGVVDGEGGRVGGGHAAGKIGLGGGEAEDVAIGGGFVVELQHEVENAGSAYR